MTTLGAILTFIKLQLRIIGTNEDAWITQSINYSQLRYARRKQWPQLRTTATFTTTSAQTYDLATDFDIPIDGGFRYYISTVTSSTILLTLVSGNDAEMWRAIYVPASDPSACQVIAGTTGASKKLALLPTFTETGIVVTYDYLKKPATLTVSGDVLTLPELSEAIAFDVCSLYMEWSRDTSGQAQSYAMRAKRSYFDACATCIQQ